MQITPEILIKEFEGFRDIAREDGEALYEKLCNIIVESEELLKFSANVQLGQPTANIMLGGVHYLLLKGYKSDLALYYPSIQQTDDVKPVDDDLEQIFKEFIWNNKIELEEICKTRRTQTNEIGRSSFVLPGLNYLYQLTNKPIVLLELGTSAGLLMMFDKYAIKYNNLNEIGGKADSELTIVCDVIGDTKPPITKLPKLFKRVGIDLIPINCSNPDEALWLQALVWPKNLQRLNSLRVALSICSQNNNQIELVQDDGFQNIVKYLDKHLSEDNVLCIYHSFAINQIAKTEREKYYNDLTQYSLKNKVLFYELTVKWAFGEDPRLVLQEFNKGEITLFELARIHHHGKWIQWLIE